MATITYPDGFPKTPLEAIEFSYFLSESEKQEWRDWLQSSTPEQQAELVDILHSMWVENQKNAVPENFANINSNNQSTPPPVQNTYTSQPVSDINLGNNQMPQNFDQADFNQQFGQFGQPSIAQPPQSVNSSPQPINQNQQFSNPNSVQNSQLFNPVSPVSNTSSSNESSQPYFASTQPPVPQNPQPTSGENQFLSPTFNFNPQSPSKPETRSNNSSAFDFGREQAEENEMYSDTPAISVPADKPDFIQSTKEKSNQTQFPSNQINTDEDNVDDFSDIQPSIQTSPRQTNKDNSSAFNIESLVKDNKYEPSKILNDNTPTPEEFVYKSEEPLKKKDNTRNRDFDREQSGNKQQDNRQPRKSQGQQLKRERRESDLDLGDLDVSFSATERRDNRQRDDQSRTNQPRENRENQNRDTFGKENRSRENRENRFSGSVQQGGKGQSPNQQLKKDSKPQSPQIIDLSITSQTETKEILDGIYREYIEAHNVNQQKLTQFMETVTKALAGQKTLNDNSRTTTQKLLQINEEIIKLSQKIQKVENFVKNTVDDISQKVDENSYRLDMVDKNISDAERRLRDFTIKHRTQINDVSERLTAVESNIFGDTVITQELELMKANIFDLQRQINTALNGRTASNLQNNNGSQNQRNNQRKNQNNNRQNDDSASVKTSNMDLRGIL